MQASRAVESSRAVRRGLRLALATLLTLTACPGDDPLEVVPQGALTEHYLLDLVHIDDPERLFATQSHVLLLNPGDEAARVTATFYFEARAPETRSFEAPPGHPRDLRLQDFPVRPGERFAVRLESDRPVAAQATVGWTNTRGDYRPGARTLEPEGVREVARSYLSTRSLATDWLVVDGVVLDDPSALWIRESEWVLLLNPSPQPATVSLSFRYAPARSAKGRLRDTLAGDERLELRVPAERLLATRLDAHVRANRQYSVHARSDHDVALHWLREVRWNDRDAPMATWSVPGLALRAQSSASMRPASRASQ